MFILKEFVLNMTTRISSELFVNPMNFALFFLTFYSLKMIKLTEYFIKLPPLELRGIPVTYQ